MSYLALDLGEKRIGVAVSDSLKIIATAYLVFTRRSRREDFERIRGIVREKKVEKIVIGLPVLFSGEEGRMARWVRDYGNDLAGQLNLPVEFWDESLTSDLAEAALRQQGLSRKKMKGKLDAVAAALILQSYLDSEREKMGGGVPPVPPENEDPLSG